MDQSEVNKIIMDSTEPDLGNNFEKMEKEFMILKGSIKKLILDIREQMNNTDNPFSNIQMLQMAPPAPVIKEDPIELELPKDKEEKKQKDDMVKAEADKQAAKEKTMAQEIKTSNITECPLSSKAGSAHDHCPLSANNSRTGPACPLARKTWTTDRSCPVSTHYCDKQNSGYRQPYPCESRGHETHSAGNTTNNGYPADSGDRHACATYGRLMSPAYGAYPGDWPYPYPPYPQQNWQERPGYGMRQETFHQPAYVWRPVYHDHPGAEPAQYGNPYGSAYPAGTGDDPRYGSQKDMRRRMSRAPPEYYPYHDDRYTCEPETYPYRQPADSGYEPEYYRPAPAVRRRPRAPELYDDSYYESEEPVEPARYRSAPRRRRASAQSAPEPDPADEFEMTEPIPGIDLLPDEPEREEEPLRIRKRTRATGILPEPLRPDLVEQPNPKPRRSRAIKHRS